MLFLEGTQVSYKDHTGIISFYSEQSLSILIQQGKHKSQDVKIVVYRENFKDINVLDEK